MIARNPRSEPRNPFPADGAVEAAIERAFDRMTREGVSAADARVGVWVTMADRIGRIVGRRSDGLYRVRWSGSYGASLADFRDLTVTLRTGGR